MNGLQRGIANALPIAIILLITQCACGVAAAVPTESIGHITETDILPTVVTANVETVTKTETNVQFKVTAPLHVRSCASIDCDIVAYLQPGDSVEVKWSVDGPGCAGADWYAIDWQDWTGFVCSIYVEER
jgi:hypothetical protein